MEVYVTILHKMEVDDRFSQLLNEELRDDWKQWHTLHNELCDTVKNTLNLPFSSEGAAKDCPTSIEAVETTDWECLIET